MAAVVFVNKCSASSLNICKWIESPFHETIFIYILHSHPKHSKSNFTKQKNYKFTFNTNIDNQQISFAFDTTMLLFNTYFPSKWLVKFICKRLKNKFLKNWIPLHFFFFSLFSQWNKINRNTWMWTVVNNRSDFFLLLLLFAIRYKVVVLLLLFIFHSYFPI